MYPSISVPKQCAGQGPSSQCSEHHAGPVLRSVLLGPLQVGGKRGGGGAAEQLGNAQGYLEVVPGRKTEATRVGGI